MPRFHLRTERPDPTSSHTSKAAWPCALIALCAFGSGAMADSVAPAPGPLLAATLPAVEIQGRHYDNAVGTSDAASQGVIESGLLRSRPALRPGEVLEFVPGVIVTQHSGDGKANQYFLRGFNLDHGTDFATSVSGMPVNMPTHGHGQGYSDLNFLIPELVDRIEYRKGPYFATHGDFASAGAADIVYRTRLDAPFSQLTLGERGYQRALLGGSRDLQPDLTLTGAFELMRNDGPWTVPEGLRRHNAVLTLAQGTKALGWSATAMAYEGRWTSTDQVPLALVERGYDDGRPFGRYDSLDPSDGGTTGRYSLSGEWHRRDDDGGAAVSAYVMRYRLKLWSNFTYALEREDSGDQFSQQDARTVVGLQAKRDWLHTLGGLEARTEVGAQLRHDRITVGLYDTEQRRTLATTRLDDVDETLVGLYGQTQLQWRPWLRTVAGLRLDRLDAQVDGRLATEASRANSGSAHATQLSPKLTVVLGPWADTEFFVNLGRGFHSNDARGTTAQLDPSASNPNDPGAAVKRVPGLVASRGWELGARTEAIPQLQSSLALWQLRFASELVYVGDAGATEASGASTRRGVEWNNRWTPSKHILLDADLAWTHARFDNGDRIPNAVDTVASVAATLKDLGRWSTSLQWRYLGSGALIEDNSQRSSPSSTFNLRIARTLDDVLPNGSEVMLDVFNLTDRKVNDIEYYYDYKVPGADLRSPGKVVHPAEPRTVRVTLRTTF